jgi:hypothetical protein
VKFAVQHLLTFRDWQTHAEVYHDALEESRLADEVGFDAAFSRGGVPHDRVLKSMRLFGEKVIPRLA